MNRILKLVPVLCLVVVAGCATVNGNDAESLENAGPKTMDLYREGMKAYAEGDLDTAEDKLGEVLDRVPQDAQVWFRLANIFARTDRPRLAVKAYEDALVRDPRLAKAWHNLGVVHLRQAAHAFISLADSVPAGDPLHERGEKMSNTILALLNELPEDSHVDLQIDLGSDDGTEAGGKTDSDATPDGNEPGAE